MSSEALNLEAIDAAIKQHDLGHCPFPIHSIRMAPYEVERLGWEVILGIPVVPDERMGTGRFRLECGPEEEGDPEASSEISRPETIEV